MPIMQSGVAAVANRMPKVISPKLHAIIDYAVAGSFFLMGGLFWKRHKRAAISSFICGGAITATSLITDYPGGVAKLISFPLHGRIDMGLAGVCYVLPDMMGFDKDREKWFFRMQALGETSVVAMTDFEQQRRRKYDWGRRAA
jgi:hypothetical protein